MNRFGSSECSSGCESGWTMYLDHSSGSLNPGKSVCGGGDDDDDGFFCTKEGGEKMEEDDDEEEEDLSMVSDASSGPPHCHEDDEYYCDENGYFSSSVPSALLKKSNKRQKTRKPTPPNHLHQQQQQQHQSLLDDTASSPLFSISKNNSNLKNNQASMENVLDFSQGFSATHFKGRSTFQRHFDFLPGKQTSTKPVGCRKGSGNQLW